MSMERVLAKVQRAKDAVARQAAALESHADEILAAEEAISGRMESSFAPHHAGLRDARRGLDEVERALDLLSNGAPGEPEPSSSPGEEPVAAPLPAGDPAARTSEGEASDH